MPRRRRRPVTPRIKAQVVQDVVSGLEEPVRGRPPDRAQVRALIAHWKDTALQGLESPFRG